MAALGLRCCTRAFSSCGEWGLFFVVSCGEQGLLFIVVLGLLIAVSSLAAEHRL